MEQTDIRRRAIVDIAIITVITIIAFGFYYVYKKQLINFVSDNNYSVFERTVWMGLLHFGVGGLGMCTVMAFRKEGLSYIGFSKEKMTEALKYSFVLALVFVSVTIVRGVWRVVYPFRVRWLTEIFLESSLPAMALGMMFCIIVCGSFEGMNYAYISKKLNIIYPTKKVYLSPGPIIVSLLAFGVHAVLGLNGWDHSIQTIFLVYGMLIVYAKTNNILGCVVVFGLLWNLL